METFTVYNPTRLHFGVGVTDSLCETAATFGKRVLLLYGKGSVKKYGYYDKIISQLTSAGMEIFEYSGIKSNPIIEDVHAAVKIGKENQIDLIVALGGGSVIDTAKIVGLGIPTDVDPWDFMTWKLKPLSSVPLISVLTLAATGTEMNAAAVVQNHETGQKIGFVNPLMFPVHSFLDPGFTVSVPRNYTAYGIVDLIAHAMEAFFGKGEPSVIDQITIDIIRDAMDWGPELLDNPEDIDLRYKIMLDATLALNGLTSYGKKSGDWAVHGLGHELSLLFDMPHGASLSIAYPAWLKLHSTRIPERIKKLGKGLFGVETVEETIESFEAFFRKLGSPVTLQEADVKTESRTSVLQQYAKNSVSGMHHALSEDDHIKIVDHMFG